MADISTTLAGLKLQNPTILASGILGQSGESLLRMATEGGAGAVVTKSIGLEERNGHGNPSVVELDDGLLNAMGLPNPGIDSFGDEVSRALSGNVPVIGSIFASGPGDFSILAKKMEAYGVHALELNLSCPHAKGLGLELGHDKSTVRNIVSAVKASVSIPVFTKLTPMLPDIGGMAEVVQDAGGDCIVAINTIRAMKIDTQLGMPVLKNKCGGLSGPAIKSIGVRCVYEVASKVDIPVVGVGGICSGEDAVEYMMAGASAVQIGSGVHYEGISVFSDICRDIDGFLERHGHGSLKDIIGLAQRC